MCKACVVQKHGSRCGCVNQETGAQCKLPAAYVLLFEGNNFSVCCHIHGAYTVKQIDEGTLPPGDPLNLIGIETIETM